jgi:hypothetical protein
VANKPLRIGILIDTPRSLFAWECGMLRRIISSHGAEIVLIVHGDPAPETRAAERRAQLPWSLTAAMRKITRALREKLEDKVGGFDPDAFATAQDPEPFRGVPRLRHIDTERIRAYDVDVFVGLGVDPARGEILNAARYGVWSLRYANSPLVAAHAAGFWEVFDALPVTGSELSISGPGLETERIIGRTFSATCPASVRRNRNDLYWKASFQVPRKLEALRLLGPELFFERIEQQAAHCTCQPTRLLAEPTLSNEIVLVLRIFRRIYSNRIRNFFVASQWILLFDLRHDFLPSLSRFKKIVPPNNRLWADPHVLIKDGRYFVFVEELVYRQKKGFISVMEIREDGTPTMPKRVLEEPYHLSNPFVFEHAGEIFLIPESCKNRSVDLYRCVSFPDQWEHCETLLNDVHAVDTTVHFHRGKCWLFTNIREHVSGSADDDLFLFWSDALQGGQWKPHPMNPIVSDVTRARPAGNLFEHEGKLYRPAQDCSIRYGYGMRIQEILKLSEWEYQEREVAYLEPTWDDRIIATHTLSKAGQLTLSDALQERWEVFPALRRSA